MAGQWAWNSPASVKLDLPIRATRRDCPLFSLVFYTVLLCSRESTRNRREIDEKSMENYIFLRIYASPYISVPFKDSSDSYETRYSFVIIQRYRRKALRRISLYFIHRQ